MNDNISTDSSLEWHHEYSKILQKIFKTHIEVTNESVAENKSQKFYLLLNTDRSLKYIVPYFDNASSLSYISPSRNASKLFLFGVKLMYSLRLLRYFDNVEVVYLKGLIDIEYVKFGWDLDNTPSIFISVGTVKDSQNAVVFLSSPDDFRKCIVVKVSIGRLCNLKNEYLVGGAIPQNKTNYIQFNEGEKFLSQSYVAGHRRVSKLTTAHINFLSSLMISGKTVEASVVKSDIQDVIKTNASIDRSTQILLNSLMNKISDNFLFFAAYQHGDFAPYNIVYKRYPEEFSVIDWEDSMLNGICFLDLFNYIYMHDCLFVNEEKEKLRRIVNKMACQYFAYKDNSFNVKTLKQYEYLFMISEYLKRLPDAGSDDVYVKYLLRMVKNEY